MLVNATCELLPRDAETSQTARVDEGASRPGVGRTRIDIALSTLGEPVQPPRHP
jgi:hypothetical protein